MSGCEQTWFVECVLANSVRQLRQERGWTQEQLAHELRMAGYDYRQMTISRLETAQRPTSVGELAALSLIFLVPFERLIGGAA